MRLLACVVGWWTLSSGFAGLGQTAVDGAVAGRVVLDGEQVAGTVKVNVRPVAVGGATRHVLVRADGSFVVLRLEVGEYVVEASLLGRVVASGKWM